MNISDINIRDPFILADAERGLYYLYGSRGDGRKRDGFDVYVSRDLKAFSEPREIFTVNDGFWGKYDFWAPELHFYKGAYYLFASFKADGHCRATHILRSDDPLGPFVPVSDVPATPEGHECLDGTLWIEDGIPYIVYAHEWVQIMDGEICALRLKEDLSGTVGEPIVLFRASEAGWTRAINGKGAYVTDGPFIVRTSGGRLLMLWSSFSEHGYSEGVAYSDNGRIDGRWKHDDRLLFDHDGGHGMAFTDFSGRKRFVLHCPNRTPYERAVVFGLNEKNEKLYLE